MAALGPRRRGRAGGDPRAAGHGLRGVGRPAGGERPLHDDGVPGRLCAVRPVEGPRARARLVARPADPRSRFVPLAVADDPAELVALAGMLALLVAAIEIGLGLGKLGFVADLLSKEVQVGYMNGLGVTIIVGQLPKLFGFSTDADKLPRRGAGVLRGPRRAQPLHAGGRSGLARPAADPAALHATRSRPCSSPSSSRPSRCRSST